MAKVAELDAAGLAKALKRLSFMAQSKVYLFWRKGRSQLRLLGYAASVFALFLRPYAYSAKAINSEDDPVPINTRVVGSNISLPSLFLFAC